MKSYESICAEVKIEMLLKHPTHKIIIIVVFLFVWFRVTERVEYVGKDPSDYGLLLICYFDSTRLQSEKNSIIEYKILGRNKVNRHVN